MAADLVELRMNVAALKRVDPYIKDILGTATQVALYTFSAAKNEWEKTDVEGALFVCSRNGEPYNSILIMNRLNTNNLVEPIVKDLDWQMQAPFLLYRNPRNSIFGIWFYNRDECVKTTYLLETIMDTLNKQHTGIGAVASVGSSTTASGADIFSMLSKAQEDFNKTPIKNIDNKNGQSSSTPRAGGGPPDVTSQSVMDFFAKASTTKTSHPTPARIPTGDNEPLQPLLHRLMSNPAHSVEHIEKQQRAVTPQELLQPTTLQQQPQGLSVLRAKNKLEPTAGTRNGGCTSSLLLDNGINFMRISSPTTITTKTTTVAAPSPATYYLQQTGIDGVTSAESKSITPTPSTLDNTNSAASKPQLMPPMMFAAAVDPTPLNISNISNISTTMTASATATGTASSEREIKEPMTKKQMAQAFVYLLKNDPVFLDKLHEGYVKSFQQSYS